MDLDLSTLLDICSPKIKILVLDRWSKPLPLDFLARLPNITALSIDSSHLENLPRFQSFPSYIPRYIRKMLPTRHPNRLPSGHFPDVPTFISSSPAPKFFYEKLTFHPYDILELSNVHDEHNVRRDGWSANPLHAPFILALFIWCKNETRASREMYKERSFTVIIHGFSPDMELSASLLGQLIVMTHTFIVEKFIISIGWDDLSVGGHQHDTSMSRLDELLNVLEGFTVPIVDQYCQSLQDFIAEQKMLWNVGTLKPCVLASS
ncbi:hypothetical protein CPB86DRAFT_829834 [Serendipita vermifera]|nr:hypothetical protein CPB86DRAFT_829834 [Serendipita vermifera]